MKPSSMFPRFLVCLAALILATAAVAHVAAEEAPAKRATPRPAATLEVQAVRDVAYRDVYEGEDARKDKFKLDLYLPKGRTDFPVLFFVHGGAWRTGDKSLFGLYNALGLFLARQGIGTVITNYRLYPDVQHPEHIKDVARAFAWTSKNIARYGGRPDQVFVCGHSAGGHLVALLATDERYLKAEGLTRSAIKGAIPISGVYDVTAAELKLFTNVFGTDPEVRKQASPVRQASSGSPPFLIMYADNDFRTCDLMSEGFCKALQAQQCAARTLEVKGRNHLSILLNVTRPGDPVSTALLDFIAAHTGNRPAGDTGR